MIEEIFAAPASRMPRGRGWIARASALFACVSSAFLLPSAATAEAVPAVLPVRVVVVTAAETGEDTGDRPGESQAWAETMSQQLPFPAGVRPLRYDPARQVLLITTGVGTNRAATSTMALGLDPRFDLRQAYWLVAAVAGVNPEEASAGSAAWIGTVVDTDFAFAVDPREAPKDWPIGTLALGAKAPYKDRPEDTSSNVFQLNTGLRDWAYSLTRDIKLADSEALRNLRAPYASFPKAVTPPSVLVGDEATGQTFWHGALLNTHAAAWTRYWTDGRGRFVMTAMEDSGTLGALAALGRIGKVDPNRTLILRTGANYSMPAPGVGAAESLIQESTSYSAYQPSLDAAFTVGGKVVDELIRNWDRYRDEIPTASQPAR